MPRGNHPKFRKDLIVAEHVDTDGAETVVLKDPVSERFFRLSPFEYRFLKSFDGNVSLEQVVDRMAQDGQYSTAEEGRLILGKAAQLGLMLGTRFGTAQFQQHLRQQYERARKARLFSSIYFAFIPVMDPDAFLQRTLWLFRLIANKWTALITATLAPAALYFVVSGLPDMQRQYTFFFNWENLIYLWITIGLSKLVHELAHAYTAKSFGLRVPQMGIAFLIFFPCLYCNTTDAWQLANRRQRMAISAAGIMAEGSVAIVAAYVWHYSGPGIANSVAFYLMAVSFVSTVLFNGNPLMKFDGYFLLIDYLEMPNLQGKSFGYLRYLFMNRVLGMSLVPNTASDPRESFLFVTYGVSAFIYRVFLYIGIVSTVYFRFDKMLGIVLALLAFSLFIVRPFMRGMKLLLARRSEIRPHLKEGLIVLTTSGLVVAATLVPWSSRSAFPCYVASAKVQKLTVPLETSVDSVFIRTGSLVTKGTVLFDLDVSRLKLVLLKKELQRDIAQKQVEMLLLDSKDRGRATGKQIEVFQADDEVSRIKDQLRIALSGNSAPFDGAITSLDYRLQEGYQPGEGAVVGEIQSVDECVVHALIPEKDRYKVSEGQDAQIWLPVAGGLTLKAKVERIKPYSEKDLRNSPFSSRVGGELATEAKGEHAKDSPLDAQYTCTIPLSNTDRAIALGMTGRCVVYAPRQSLLSRVIDRFLNTLNRESVL